jgi:hypothetical protein
VYALHRCNSPYLTFNLRLAYADQGWVDEDDEGFKWPWEKKAKGKEEPPPPPPTKEKKNFWEF